MIQIRCDSLCDYYHVRDVPRKCLFQTAPYENAARRCYWVPDEGFWDSFFADGFNRINEVMIEPAIMPQSNVRKIIIARDASNRQKKKVIVTGTAF